VRLAGHIVAVDIKRLSLNKRPQDLSWSNQAGGHIIGVKYFAQWPRWERPA